MGLRVPRAWGPTAWVFGLERETGGIKTEPRTPAACVHNLIAGLWEATQSGDWVGFSPRNLMGTGPLGSMLRTKVRAGGGVGIPAPRAEGLPGGQWAWLGDALPPLPRSGCRTGRWGSPGKWVS